MKIQDVLTGCLPLLACLSLSCAPAVSPTEARAEARTEKVIPDSTVPGAPGVPVGPDIQRRQPTEPKVTVFVTSWCPYCKELEGYLLSNGITYTRYDIERDPRGAMLHQQLGGGGVPVIVVGTKVMRGFDESELNGLLKRSQ